MAVAAAFACAEELEGELTQEIGRARRERLALKALDGVKIEEHLAERRDFQERAESLQTSLRGAVRAAARELGIPDDGSPLVAQLARAGEEGARLAEKLAQLAAKAAELSRINDLNQLLAGRALTVTRAYVRTLAPKPSAYDRRGAEPAHASALGSVSRRA